MFIFKRVKTIWKKNKHKFKKLKIKNKMIADGRFSYRSVVLSIYIRRKKSYSREI